MVTQDCVAIGVQLCKSYKYKIAVLFVLADVLHLQTHLLSKLVVKNTCRILLGICCNRWVSLRRHPTRTNKVDCVVLIVEGEKSRTNGTMAMLKVLFFRRPHEDKNTFVRCLFAVTFNRNWCFSPTAFSLLF